MEELPGPPIFAPDLRAAASAPSSASGSSTAASWARRPARRGATPRRWPRCSRCCAAASTSARRPGEPGTIQWDFADADPWHLVVANGDTRVQPGRAEAADGHDRVPLRGLGRPARRPREPAQAGGALRRLRPKRRLALAVARAPACSPPASAHPVDTRRRARARGPRAPHHRAASAADPLQHGQPAGQRGGGAGVAARACSRRPASSASCSPRWRGARTWWRACARGSDGPALCLLGHVDTVLADPVASGRVDPWSGELRDGCVWGRGAVDMKSQVAAEAAAAIALWRGGLAAGGRRAAARVHRRRGDRRRERRPVALPRAPGQGAGRLRRQRGRRRCCRLRRAPRLRGVRSRRRACSASRSPPRAAPATPRFPRLGDNALARMAPGADRPARAPRAARSRPEAEAFLGRARPRRRRPRGGAARARGEPIRALAVLARADARRQHDPDDHARGREDQRDPLARRSSRSTAACRRSRARTTCARALRGGARGGRLPRSSSATTVVRQPLAGRHAADGLDPALRRARGPGRRGGAAGVPGFSDSHWWRAAFPECVVYGFFPQRAMDAVEAVLAHARGRRAHPGRGPRPGRRASTLSSWMETLR